MIIHSDWHIHSEFSYDSSLPTADIVAGARQLSFRSVGITDHVNYNDARFIGDLQRSAEHVRALAQTQPRVVLGVELTPIAKPEFDHIARYGTAEGFDPPSSPLPYDIELALTREQLMALGVRYAIGASHWRVDGPNARRLPPDRDAMIREWYRQQMWLACDERVTILGHPWYSGSGVWYEDLSVIPHSMNLDIAAALKENGKYVECNRCMLSSAKATERFKQQYAELLREMFELGIPVTFGSDAHNTYMSASTVELVERYLAAAGFVDGDIVEVAEGDLW